MSGPADEIERPELSVLEAALGYRFRDPDLLVKAVRHSSYANEREGLESNERMEFLGDSVLGLAVAGLLYEANPDWQEGDLSLGLHRLVDRTALAQLARAIDLGPYLCLGRTEIQAGGAAKDSILADAMEAVIGAMYLDSGLEPVIVFLKRAFGDALRENAEPVEASPKTRFQEAVMARHGEFPRYAVVGDTGVEGDEQRYTIEARVLGESVARGVGRSKRVAEKAAAVGALRWLDEQEAADG